MCLCVLESFARPNVAVPGMSLGSETVCMHACGSVVNYAPIGGQIRTDITLLLPLLSKLRLQQTITDWDSMVPRLGNKQKSAHRQYSCS